MSLRPTDGALPDPHLPLSSATTSRPRKVPDDQPSLPPPPSTLSGVLSWTAADTKLDILLWSIVIPGISLTLFARSLCTTLRQDPAAASHAPLSFLQLFSANLQITQLMLGCLPRLLTILTLSATCSAAAWLAPSWYLQRGREQLLAAARLLPKAITVLQLLLLPSHPLGVLQRVWLQTSIIGAKGLLGVLTWPLLFPTPVQSYLQLAPLECGLALAADVMFTFKTSSPPAFPPLSRIAMLVLLYAVCGFALPAGLLTKARQRRYHSFDAQRPPQPQGSCTEPMPPGHEASRPSHSKSVPPQDAPAALSVPSPMQHPLVAASATAAATAAKPNSTGGPIGSRRALYGGRSTARALSVKIHDHAAFSHREAILASLKPTLLHGARSAPNPAPASHPVLLATCAVEGCLQLLITASTLDGTDPFNLSPGDDLSAFFCQLHAQLPASCVDDLITINLDDTVATFKGGRGQQPPPVLLHLPARRDGSEGLQWAPICFEAGSQEEVEVEVTCGMSGLGVEAVVQYGSEGRRVAVKLHVEEVAGSHASARLKVPAQLDPGPVAFYLLSTQQGMKGILLGSATTMALPPAAAAELLQAYQEIDIDAADTPLLEQQDHEEAASAEEYRAGLRRLLGDLATLWQLHGKQLPDQDGLSSDLCPAPSSQAGDAVSAGCNTSPCKPAAQLSSEVLQYLAGNSLPECHAVMSARRNTTVPNVAVPADAATAAAGKLAATAATGAREPLAGSISCGATACTAPRTAAPTALNTALAGASAAADTEAVETAARPSEGPRAAAAAAVEADGVRLQPSAVHHLLAGLAGMLRWPASLLRPLAAASRDPGYSAWRQQQGRRLATLGGVVLVVIAAVAIWKNNRRLSADLGSGMPWAWAMGTMLLHLLSFVGPYVVLLLGREYFWARRASVVVAFALLRALIWAAGLLGWLSVPRKLRATWSSTWGAVIIHGVFRPCLQQVPWRVQLLTSSIEEACKYVVQADIASTSIAVVLVALAVSGLVEVLYLAVYARAAKAAKEVPGDPSGQ